MVPNRRAVAFLDVEVEISGNNEQFPPEATADGNCARFPCLGSC